MSSYFVNQLTNCYTQDGGGGGRESVPEHYPQASSPYHRASYGQSYPAYGSPSPGAATGHTGGEYYGGLTHRLTHPPMGSREKLSPPASGMGSAETAIGATNPRSQQNRSPEYKHQTSNTSTASSNYSNNSSVTHNNVNNHHSGNNGNNSLSSSGSSSAGSQSGGDLAAMDSPPPQRARSVSSPESSSPPAAAQTGGSGGTGGGGPGSTTGSTGGTGSDQDPASPTQSPTSAPQIYPWMRRQHSGTHNNGMVHFLIISYIITDFLKSRTCKIWFSDPDRSKCIKPQPR